MDSLRTQLRVCFSCEDLCVCFCFYYILGGTAVPLSLNYNSQIIVISVHSCHSDRDDKVLYFSLCIFKYR